MDYLSYGYALAITLGGVIGYVKAGIKVDVREVIKCESAKVQK